MKYLRYKYQSYICKSSFTTLILCGYQDNLPLILYDIAKVRATSSVVIQCQSLTRVQIYLFIIKDHDINMILQIHNHKTVKLESTVYSSSDLVTVITEVSIKFLNHVVNNQIVFLEVTCNCKSIRLSN